VTGGGRVQSVQKQNAGPRHRRGLLHFLLPVGNECVPRRDGPDIRHPLHYNSIKYWSIFTTNSWSGRQMQVDWKLHGKSLREGDLDFFSVGRRKSVVLILVVRDAREGAEPVPNWAGLYYQEQLTTCTCTVSGIKRTSLLEL
jgi:hypothetical protein